MAAEVGHAPLLPAPTDRWSVNVAQLTESMDGRVRALTDLVQKAGAAKGAQRQQLEAAMLATRRELRALDEVLARALREEEGVLPATQQRVKVPELCHVPWNASIEPLQKQKFTSRDEEESIMSPPITPVEPQYLNGTDIRPKFQVHQLATLGMPPPHRPQPPIPVLIEDTGNRPPSPPATPATVPGEVAHDGAFFSDPQGHGVSREASKPVARRRFSNVGAEKSRGLGEVEGGEERDVVGEAHRRHTGTDQAVRNRSASTPLALSPYSPVLGTRTSRSQSVDGGGLRPPQTPTHTGGSSKRKIGDIPMDIVMPMDPQQVLSPKQLGAIVRTWRAAVGGREGGEAFPLACLAMEYRVRLADYCPEVAARMMTDLLYLTELFSTLVSMVVPSLSTRGGPNWREHELLHIAGSHFTLGFGRSTYVGAYKALYAAVRHRAGPHMDDKAQEAWLQACSMAVDMLGVLGNCMHQAEAGTLKEKARRKSAADKAPPLEVASLHEPSPKQAGALGCTWRLLAEGCGGIGGGTALPLAVLTALFYDELYRRAPGAHMLLQDNLRAQSLYLTQLIANIVPTLDPARQSSNTGPDQDLLLIGPQHAQWGLGRDFYKRSCNAITAVVRTVLGVRFDARMREAWLVGCAHACERLGAAQAHHMHVAGR